MAAHPTSLHQYSMANQANVEASALCGCFHCCSLFPPGDIRIWLKERTGEKTAQCPLCGIDAVLPAHGLPATLDRGLLETLHDEFFS